MKKWVLTSFISVIYSLVMLANSSFASSPKTTKSLTANKAIKLLFVLHADSANFDQKTHRLTLTKLDPHLLVFSDRPYRISYTIPVKQLIDNWNKGFTQSSFKSSPPNAALFYGTPQSGRQTALIVSLSDPRYNKHRVLSLKIGLVGMHPSIGSAKITLDTIPKSLHHVWITVDGHNQPSSKQKQSLVIKGYDNHPSCSEFWPYEIDASYMNSRDCRSHGVVYGTVCMAKAYICNEYGCNSFTTQMLCTDEGWKGR